MIDQQLNQRDVPQMARDVTEPFRLGRALLMLGSRESETAHLQEATKAYRAALKEMTRDREPLSWAHLQSLLGVAFLTLGERESGTARLKEAVTAFRNAHKEYTRDRAPLEWAVVQTGLATALATQGWHEIGTDHLMEAIAAHRAALEERTRDAVSVAASHDALDAAQLSRPAFAGASISAWTMPYAVPIRWQKPARSPCS